MQPSHSDLANEARLMLRMTFHLPLRQTRGLVTSIFDLLGVDLQAPNHRTVSRRAMNLKSISKGSVLCLRVLSIY